MAALVGVPAQPDAGTVSRLRGYTSGNVKVRYFDVTLDTGDYAQTGLAITAASLGFDRVYFVTISGGLIMSTNKLVGNVNAVSYAAGGASFNIFLYESAADGDALDNKPAEANTAVFPFRIRVEGV
jgi:hypothetical protein